MDPAECEKLFEPYRRSLLLAGFSGGADSTAALLVAWYWSERFDFKLMAVHFNHGLRGAESDREEAAARDFCKVRGIDFACRRFELAQGPGVEARARAARLTAWRKLVSETGASAVVLGHHADDRVENLLIRLGRGSNATGLTSMRVSSVVGGVRFLRPLLHFRRAGIEAFLRDSGVSCWACDSSNRDEHYSRNALRNHILPELYSALPGSADGLTASLDALDLDADFLEQEAKKAFDSLKSAGHPASEWLALHPALRFRALRLLLADFAGVCSPIAPGFEVRVRSELASVGKACRLIPTGVAEIPFIRLEDGRLLPPVAKKQAVSASVDWKWREKTVHCGGFIFTAEFVEGVPPAPGLDECCFDAGLLPDTLRVMPCYAGAKMIPFGKSTPVSIKKLRIDRGIAAAGKPPLVCTPDGIVIWCPLVRQGAYAAVAASTRETVLFRAKRY